MLEKMWAFLSGSMAGEVFGQRTVCTKLSMMQM